MMTKWIQLNRRIKNCSECEGLNKKEKTESAPGYGNKKARVMIIGQSLCTACMATQVPFTGGSGKILDRAFKLARIQKKDVFITNMLKCHPPNNRPSKPYEIDNCSTFLRKEVKYVRPSIIIGLGTDVKNHIMPSADWNTVYRETTPGIFEGKKLLFLYHPAYFLRMHGAKGKKTKEYVKDLAKTIRRYHNG